MRDIYKELIIENHEGLNVFHKEMLCLIFDAFDKKDPSSLKSFDTAFNHDDELLLFRKSEYGLTNIIINPDDCIAYSFISYSKTWKNDVLYFVYPDGDFEKLVNDFFSN